MGRTVQQIHVGGQRLTSGQTVPAQRNYGPDVGLVNRLQHHVDGFGEGRGVFDTTKTDVDGGQSVGQEYRQGGGWLSGGFAVEGPIAGYVYVIGQRWVSRKEQFTVTVERRLSTLHL